MKALSLSQTLPFGLGDEFRRLFSILDDEANLREATSAWVPAVDIHELEDRFEILVDLPGVDPADVEMMLEQRMLTISGERRRAHAQEEQRSVQARLERGVGRFLRRFLLPEAADTAQIKASHRHGVLEITVPKQQKAQPRRIKIAA